MQIFYPPSTNSPVATLLLTGGLAAWLQQLGAASEDAPFQADLVYATSGAQVRVSRSLDASQTNSAQMGRPLNFIQTAKTKTTPSGGVIIDYEAERQHNATYFAQLAELRKRGIVFNKLPAEERNAIEAGGPRTYWSAVAAINQMGALNAYNKVVELWSACVPYAAEFAAVIWTLCDGKPDAEGRAIAEWTAFARAHGLLPGANVSATQVVNPDQGKGGNKLKADGLGIGGMESFWPLEYFKFYGLFTCAVPRQVQGKKDRKLYVLIPSAQGVAQFWHKDVFDEFQKVFRPTSAIKMDIAAVLRCADALIGEWQKAQQSTGRRRRTNDYIDGLAAVSFKDLGSAVAVMNAATLGLPPWIAWPADASTAQQQREFITQHLRIIMVIGRRGNEEKLRGDEEQLLRDYRDFLTDRDPRLGTFFTFIAGYATYVLREQARQFSVQVITEVVMAQDDQRKQPLGALVTDPGFLNLARAIRESTVYQQFQGDNLYEVRYGLAGELRRSARGRETFIQALSEFVQQFSQENARVGERMRKQKRDKYRRRILITPDDLSRLLQLLDTYDTTTVAHLLLAYGYASDIRPKSVDGGTRASITADEDDVSVGKDDETDGDGDTDTDTDSAL